MRYMDEVTKDLCTYLPPLTRQPDFDLFWEDTLKQTRAVPLNLTRTRTEHPIDSIIAEEITYQGFDETPIHGWFLRPVFVTHKEKLPCLIHYHGFTGNRGRPEDFLQWLMMGVAVISVDCREQSGPTGNCGNVSGGYVQNLSCKGIHNKHEYYYRMAYMDCLKALDVACALPEVDPAKLVIEGGSQGGALGMAVCALDSRPAFAMLDVPSNSNLVRRVEGAHGSFSSVTEYLRRYPDRTEAAFETLSYFDTMNMAERISCPVMASVALKDEVCPARCYFASYNRIQGEKEIHIYPFNGHEGGRDTHNRLKMEYLKKKLF